MAESRDTEPQPASNEPLPEKVMAQLTEIAALLSLTAERYQQQAQLTRQTAQAEMALSRRSLIIAAALLVALGAGVVMLWGMLLVFAGYLLLQTLGSVPVTVAILFGLQLAALYWCWRNIRYLLKQVGFSHTLAQVKALFRFTPEPAGEEHANRSADQ
ncbi:hypothetical protein WG68_00350 [Arsukibacterium ikkense]|uniref:Uncharacterized protein n=1 Tax=Arsukibacterium ikkense TaxID=336831 RepID=A0A0M2VDF3_9GAMM|nr:hypothetical protein [Arsukibacterium ikkense]KKO47143.1 hypothetical protein WG68_00350 [Arsukibacterium ikkense]